MAIAVYFNPAAMSAAQYDQVIAALEAAGAGSPKGRTHHSCFGSPSQLMVYDIWDSTADFEAFGATLMPILARIGVDPGEPAVMPIHNRID